VSGSQDMLLGFVSWEHGCARRTHARWLSWSAGGSRGKVKLSRAGRRALVNPLTAIYGDGAPYFSLLSLLVVLPPPS
jgi:hypothetical protein